MSREKAMLFLCGVILGLISFVTCGFSVFDNDVTNHIRGDDDVLASWPSPDQVKALGATLDGYVILPGTYGFNNATKMLNSRFDSHFGAVVYPQSADDVKRAILFARENGLRPTILSSGHCFVGRSSGTHTFHINLSQMNHLDVNMDDPDSDTGMSVTTGPGNSWQDIYREVDNYPAVVVGGGCPSVSPSGFTLGGGQSHITRVLGLGVDNVLSMTLVTANGTLINITQNGGIMEHPDDTVEPLYDRDLWWALLGGGGGVYGVVTSFRFKLHPAPEDGFIAYDVTYPTIHPTDGYIGAQVIRGFNQWLRYNATREWGAYIVIGNEPPLGEPELGQGYITFVLKHFGGWATAVPSIQPLVDLLPEYQVARAFQHYDTFFDWQGLVPDDPSPRREFMVGKLMQNEDLEPESSLPETLESFINMAGERFYCGGTLIGGASTDFDNNVTSVSPDLRTSPLAISCFAYWEDESEDESNIEMMRPIADALYQHGTGVYYNEPDFYLEDWRLQFWGSLETYGRLLEVKLRWDPDDMFWCHHCVGEELIAGNYTQAWTV